MYILKIYDNEKEKEINDKIIYFSKKYNKMKIELGIYFFNMEYLNYLFEQLKKI